MAVITQRENGQWQAKIRAKGYPAQSSTFPTKTEATAWAKATETDMRRGSWRDTASAATMTFKQLLEEYAKTEVPKKRGHEMESIRIRVLQNDKKLAPYKLTALTSIVISKWRDSRLSAGCAGSTVNRELAIISAVLNFGRKELNLAIENVVRDVSRPKNPPPRTRRFIADEQSKLMAALQDHSGFETRADGKQYRVGTRNLWIKPTVQLALETGMRRSELISLQWEDINLEKQVARVRGVGGRATKNGDLHRDVPLSKAAVAVLNDLQPDLSQRKGACLPLSAAALKKGFERACARAGLADFHFHDLRHEATSRLAEKLPNVIELASVTGHKSVQMLARYYHPRASDLALKLD
jgi:integrase